GKRLSDFEASQRLYELTRTHPIADSHPKVVQLAQALKDMEALVAGKEVIARWPDYRDAFENAFAIYRDAYIQAYAKVRSDTEATLASVKTGEAYLQAPLDKRDDVVGKLFGVGRACHYPPITLSTVSSLLDAANRRSLTSLAQALVALPGYQTQV